jgi:hypothetical protein
MIEEMIDDENPKFFVSEHFYMVNKLNNLDSRFSQNTWKGFLKLLMVSQSGSYGFKIMGKTSYLTVVQKSLTPSTRRLWALSCTQRNLLSTIYFLCIVANLHPAQSRFSPAANSRQCTCFLRGVSAKKRRRVPAQMIHGAILLIDFASAPLSGKILV